MTAYDECAYTWRDAWVHTCHLPDNHDGKCLCSCASETWRAAS